MVTSPLAGYFRLPLFVFALAVSGMAASIASPSSIHVQESASPAQADQNQVFRTLADQVIVDLIVRDKEGHPILDLARDEVQLFEDGEEQDILSLQLIRGDSLLAEGIAVPETGDPVPGPQSSSAFSGLNRPGLVCLVFERLGHEARSLIRDASMNAVEQIVQSGLYAAVFVSDERLMLVQEFTRDVDKLKEAVLAATTKPRIDLQDYSASITQNLRDRSEIERAAERLISEGTGGQSMAALSSAAQALANEYKLVTMTLRILQMAQFAQDSMGPQNSLYALLSLVREQGQIAGRKSILYFTEGWEAPYNAADLLATLISEANRSQVSFYAIDAQGLSTDTMMRTASETLNQAVEVSRSQLMSTTPGVTRDQVLLAEVGENAIRQNTLGNLSNLAYSTGGTLVANTNEFSETLTRAIHDLSSYYEISYRSTNRVYDGRFRSISIEVARPHGALQARRGYFALPPSSDTPLRAYETPLMVALADSSAVNQIGFHAKLLQFETGEEGTHFQLAVEVPIRRLTFSTNEESSLYQTRFSLIALIRSEDGVVIRRFSRDYPLQGPLDRLEALKKGSVIHLEDLYLSPGRYRLEAAVFDGLRDEASVRRESIEVPAADASLQVGSMFLVRSIDPRPPSASPDDPLIHGRQRVVPQISERITTLPRRGVPVFLKVSYQPDSPDRPDLTFELMKDGSPVFEGESFHGSRHAPGVDSFLATLPVSDPATGRYEIIARIRYLDRVVQRSLFFTIDPQE